MSFINRAEFHCGCLAGCCLGLLAVSSEWTELHNPKRLIYWRRGMIWMSQNNLHPWQPSGLNKENSTWVRGKIRHCTASQLQKGLKWLWVINNAYSENLLIFSWMLLTDVAYYLLPWTHLIILNKTCHEWVPKNSRVSQFKETYQQVSNWVSTAGEFCGMPEHEGMVK